MSSLAAYSGEGPQCGCHLHWMEINTLDLQQSWHKVQHDELEKTRHNQEDHPALSLSRIEAPPKLEKVQECGGEGK